MKWLILLWLLLGGKKGRERRTPESLTPAEREAVAPEPAPPAARPPAPPAAQVRADAQSLSYQERYAGLARRAIAGDPWREVLAQTAPEWATTQTDVGPAVDLRWVNGVARLIGIESAGQPSARSQLGEIGLLQIRRRFAVPGTLTEAEFTAYGRSSTSRETLARLSWKIIAHLDARAPSAWPVEARIWRVGMRHGLPALMSDLVEKGFVLVADSRGPAPGTQMDAARESYQPDELVARFAARGVGPVGWRVLVRFVTRGDLIAGWRRDWP